MRAIRIFGACAVALALCGVTANVAAAEYPLTGLPEIGRCVAVTSGTGEFNNATCYGRDKDGNDGAWDWKPGPGEHGTFKILLSGPVIETVGGGKIGCTQGLLTGEYTNGKELKVTKTLLQGCANVGPNKPCYSSPTAMGTIESTQTLVGAIGFIANPRNESSPFVGVDLKSEIEATPMVTFTCGETLGLETVMLEGSVIGKILHVGRMFTTNNVSWTEVRHTKGHQNPESFRGGVKDTITETVTPVSNPLERKSEQAALTTLGEVTNGEAIEFKAKQH